MAYRDELEAARARIAELEARALPGTDARTLRAERDAAILRVEALALRVREIEATLAALRRDREAALADARRERDAAEREIASLEARVRALSEELASARSPR